VAEEAREESQGARERVEICDVTLRDGMQALNRDAVVPIEERRRLAEALQRAGVPYLEVGSFVNPRVIPAMADTPELLAALDPAPGRELAALVPNLKYYRKLREAPHVDTVALLVSASERYSRVNTRMSREQAVAAAREVASAARGDGYRVRAYLSYAFREMGDDGDDMSADTVVGLCEQLLEEGCQTLALSDTDGRATLRHVELTVTRLAEALGTEPLGVHLHDRYGTGLANALRAYQLGVRTFDSSVGGIGGNRLVKNAVGNVATEELVYMFEGLGVDTGVDADALLEAGRIVHGMARRVGDPVPPSKLLKERLQG